MQDKKLKAKRKPILELYPYPLKKIGRNMWRSKCIFHEDTGSPNLTIYAETNTYHCFACGANGDSIALYMKLHSIDFKTAIGELSK